MTARVHDAGRAFRVVAASPSLARAELAFGATAVAEAAFTVALGVVAFQDGGAARVGLVAVLRLLPSALLAPIATAFADRWPRERVLVTSSVLLASFTTGCAVGLATGGRLGLVYGFAALSSIAVTPYRAAHSALLPSLCRTTEELAASNIVRGMVESVSVIAGPLVAASLIEVAATWTVFAAASLSAAASALLLLRLPYERPPSVAGTARGRVMSEVAHGIRASAANADVRWLMGLAGTQTFLRGCLNVFTVVLAIDVLERGESGVGVLQAALGVGAVVGSIGTTRLVGARRMAAWFGAGVAMWGIPICLIGAVPTYASTLALLAVIGVANAVLDVALFTMMGRLIADEVLARVFGVFESLVALTVALGSVAAAVAIDLIGIRAAMAVLGAVAPVAILLATPRLTRLDRLLAVRQRELDVLQQVPMLRTLPVPTIEHLARHITPRRLRAGEVVLREGTPGSRFYVIAAGEVDVRKGGRWLRTMGPGDGFGEISLLRGVQRTATVTASANGAVDLLSLDRKDFVVAVGGYPPAALAAAATMSDWQGTADSSDLDRT